MTADKPTKTDLIEQKLSSFYNKNKTIPLAKKSMDISKLPKLPELPKK